MPKVTQLVRGGTGVSIQGSLVHEFKIYIILLFGREGGSEQMSLGLVASQTDKTPTGSMRGMWESTELGCNSSSATSCL